MHFKKAPHFPLIENRSQTVTLLHSLGVMSRAGTPHTMKAFTVELSRIQFHALFKKNPFVTADQEQRRWFANDA